MYHATFHISKLSLIGVKTLKESLISISLGFLSDANIRKLKTSALRGENP